MTYTAYLKSPSLRGSVISPSRELNGSITILAMEWGVGTLLDSAIRELSARPQGKLLRVVINGGTPTSGQLGRLMTAGTRMATLEVLVVAGGTAAFYPLRLTFSSVGVEGLSSSEHVGGLAKEEWLFSYRSVRSAYTVVTSTGAAGQIAAADLAITNF